MQKEKIIYIPSNKLDAININAKKPSYYEMGKSIYKYLSEGKLKETDLTPDQKKALQTYNFGVTVANREIGNKIVEGNMNALSVGANTMGYFANKLFGDKKASYKDINSSKSSNVADEVGVKNSVGKFIVNTLTDPFSYIPLGTVNKGKMFFNWEKNIGKNLMAKEVVSNAVSKSGNLVKDKVKKGIDNIYRINPYAFKPNPEAYYRGIGRTGLDDAISSGKLRLPKDSPYKEVYFSDNFNVAKGYSRNKSTFVGDPFGEVGDEWREILPKDSRSYIAEIPKNKIPDAIPNSPNNASHQWSTKSLINTSDAKLYKEHWLKGYKEVSQPIKKAEEFVSDIDWGKWNKEIPKNKALMQEYNAIEQQAKANGTWMKNPDGSAFQGTPEQFIQQNSKNFKKAFPNGYKTVYRGEMAGDAHLTGDVGNNRTIFTADKETGQHYAGSKGKLFELYHPESANNLSFNNNGRSWRNISRNHFGENPPELDVLSGRLNTPQTGNYTSTDDIAKWIEDNNKDYVNINNIFDGTDAEFVRMVNHKKGNYLKSAIGNNGMFDMTNPNIYKGLIPIGIGTSTISNINNNTSSNNKESFDEWYKKVPKEKSDTLNYRLRYGYENNLIPQDQLDEFVKNPKAHLMTAYFNEKTGEYDFLKSKNHETINKELDWFYGNTQDAIDFRKKFRLDKTGEYYKYIPIKKYNYIPSNNRY